MPEQPSWPGGEITEAELNRIGTLAHSALWAPEPTAQAEQASQERAMAAFQEAVFPRGRDQGDELQKPWPNRMRRVIRRILRK